MLLHIGENRFVPIGAIVTILPADHVSKDTERLIRDCVEALLSVLRTTEVLCNHRAGGRDLCLCRRNRD